MKFEEYNMRFKQFFICQISVSNFLRLEEARNFLTYDVLLAQRLENCQPIIRSHLSLALAPRQRYSAECIMEKTTATSIYQHPWHLKPCRENPYFYSTHDLNYDLKKIAARACGSVVGILSCLDGAKIFRCSGFVVESIEVNGKFISTLFTSASALRREAHVNVVANDIKISVLLPEGITCDGELVGYDFHYNLGLLTIETNMPVATSKLKHLDDSISFDPSLYEDPYNYDPQCEKFCLFPGDTVVSLGRYHSEKNGLMIVAGKYSVTQTRFDCENLLRAECVIAKHGIGGPLINCYGEVIGINFFAEYCTPFLPINIVSMWWGQIKKNGHCILPRHAMKLSNLYLEVASFLEFVMQNFPNTFKGVVVDKVASDSPACSTKILPSDIIVECDGKSVGGVLEFSELIWDKAGESVQLTLLRPYDGSRSHVTMVVGNIGPNHLNRWPLPEPNKRVRSSSNA